MKVLFNPKPFLELVHLHDFLFKKNLYSTAMLNFSQQNVKKEKMLKTPGSQV